MHILNIDISRNSKCRFLTIKDESLYDVNSTVSNTILEINPPGKSCFYTFNLLTGWCSKTLSCEDFDLCCVGDCKTVLPDGNYEIKYSVTPNLSTMIEVNHFRVCQIMNSYIKLILNFFHTKCDLSASERKLKQQKLLEIKELIDNSIYMAEEGLDVDSAYELYNEAKDLINDYGNSSCGTCK